jgi:hypothetical protein
MRRWAVCGRMYVPRGVFGSLGMQGRHARPRGFIRLRAGRARSPPASRRWARGMRRSPPALHPPPIRAGPRAVAMPPPAKRAQGTARIIPQRTAELHAGRRWGWPTDAARIHPARIHCRMRAPIAHAGRG